MKARHLVPALIAWLVFATVGLAQKGAAVSATELAEITARGRLLAAYDSAAWHATDAVEAMHPAQGSFHKYIGKRTPTGWVVIFGRFGDAGDKFLVAYEATQAEDAQHFSVKHYDPPQEDRGFYFHAAIAIDTALHDFQGPTRRYNVAVLPADSDHLFVYVYPAQIDKSVFVMGADARFLVSGDGSTIIDKHQMHKAIIEFRDPGEGKRPVAGMHGHVLSDSPEDSDVFYVLSRKPSLPEGVVTKSRTIYMIEIDGSIGVKKF